MNWLIRQIKFLPILLLIMGLGLTQYYAWWSPPPSLLWELLIAAFFLAAIVCILGLNIAYATFSIFAIFVISLLGIGPLTTVIMYLIGAYLYGSLFGRLVKFQSEPLVIVALGFAVIGIAITYLSHFKINYPQTYLVAYLLICLLEVKKQNFRLLNFKQSPGILKFNFIYLFFAFLWVIFFYFVSVLPELGHDGMAMHMTIPRRIFESHIWRYDYKQYIWALQPMGAEFIYTPAYFFGGGEAVRLLNNIFVVLTGLLIFSFAHRQTKSNNLAMGFALCFVTTPLCFYVMGSTFVEPVFLFFITTTFLLLLQGNVNWTVLAVIYGFACTIRLSGLLFAPFIYAYFFWSEYKNNDWQLFLQKLIKLSIVLAISGGAGYAFAYYVTGNPFFPLFNHIFKSEFFSTAESYNPFWKNIYGISSVWLMVFKSGTFGDVKVDGALGLTYFVFFPVVILFYLFNLRKLKNECVLILGVVFFIYALFSTQAYVRYILPIFAIVILFFIQSVNHLPIKKGWLNVILLVLVGINLLKIPSAAGYIPLHNYKIYLNADAMHKFFTEARPYGSVGKILAEFPQFSGKKILLLGEHFDPAYYYFPDNTIAYSWHSLEMFENFNKNGHDLKKTIKDLKIDLIVCSAIPVSGDRFRLTEQCLSNTTPVFVFGKIYVGTTHSD